VFSPPTSGGLLLVVDVHRGFFPAASGYHGSNAEERNADCPGECGFAAGLTVPESFARPREDE